MAKFRGLHIVAGIAAMMLAAVLGTFMGLTNTAVVMSSCVVYVAVAMWADGRITRHRRAAALEQARRAALEGEQEGEQQGFRPVQRSLSQDEASKREGRKGNAA